MGTIHNAPTKKIWNNESSETPNEEFFKRPIMFECETYAKPANHHPKCKN